MKCVVFVGPLAMGLVLVAVGWAGPVEGNVGKFQKLQAHEKLKLAPITFRGHQRACVILIGDHDPPAELAIFVYDSQGRLVAKDEHRDFCAAIWYPPTTASYTIEIENRGEIWNKCRLAIK
jgi:hypothetical protein